MVTGWFIWEVPDLCRLLGTDMFERMTERDKRLLLLLGLAVCGVVVLFGDKVDTGYRGGIQAFGAAFAIPLVSHLLFGFQSAILRRFGEHRKNIVKAGMFLLYFIVIGLVAWTVLPFMVVAALLAAVACLCLFVASIQYVVPRSYKALVRIWRSELDSYEDET